MPNPRRGNRRQTQQQLQHRHHIKNKNRADKWQQQNQMQQQLATNYFGGQQQNQMMKLQGNSSVGNGFSFGGAAAATPSASSPAATSTNSSVGNGFSFGGGAASTPFASSPAATSTNSSVGNGFSFGGGAVSTPFASSPAATSTNSSVGNGFSFGGGTASTLAKSGFSFGGGTAQVVQLPPPTVTNCGFSNDVSSRAENADHFPEEALVVKVHATAQLKWESMVLTHQDIGGPGIDDLAATAATAASAGADEQLAYGKATHGAVASAAPPPRLRPEDYRYEVKLPNGDYLDDVDVEHNMGFKKLEYRVVEDDGVRPMKPGTKIEERRQGSWNLNCTIISSTLVADIVPRTGLLGSTYKTAPLAIRVEASINGTKLKALDVANQALASKYQNVQGYLCGGEGFEFEYIKQEARWYTHKKDGQQYRIYYYQLADGLGWFHDFDIDNPTQRGITKKSPPPQPPPPPMPQSPPRLTPPHPAQLPPSSRCTQVAKGIFRLERMYLRAGAGNVGESFLYSGTAVLKEMPLGGRQLQPHGKAGRAGDDKAKFSNVALYANGDEFRGSFILGKPWGFGAFRYCSYDSSFHVGHYANGLRHGPGVFVDGTTGEVFEGDWREGTVVAGKDDDGGDAAALSLRQHLAEFNHRRSVFEVEKEKQRIIQEAYEMKKAVAAEAEAMEKARIALAAEEKAKALLAAAEAAKSIDESMASVATINPAHSSIVYCLFAAPNSRVYSASYDKTVKVWDATAPHVNIATLTGHTDKVYCVVVHDDLVFSSGKEKEIRVWDANTNTSLTTLSGHSDEINTLAVVSGRYLFSGSDDRTIRVWDIISRGISGARTFALVHTIQTGQPSGSYVLSLVEGNGTVYSGGSKKDSGTIRAWSLNNYAQVATMTGHKNSVYTMTYSNNKLISASADHTVRVWDGSNNTHLTTLTDHTDIVWTVIAHNNRIFSGSRDKSICVYDANTYALLRKIQTSHTSHISSLRVSNTGKLFSASADKTIQVWEKGDLPYAPTTKSVHFRCVTNNGVAYRMSTSFSNRDQSKRGPDKGDVISAFELPDGWLKLTVRGEVRFLPMRGQNGEVFFTKV